MTLLFCLMPDDFTFYSLMRRGGGGKSRAFEGVNGLKI